MTRNKIIKKFTFLLFFIISSTAKIQAQLIPLKTVPVASGNQFLFYPSQNLGMGGLSIALNDPLHDPFVNPAKGACLRGIFVFSTPALYTLSEKNGSAQTLPFGLLFGSEQIFGGLSVSIQQLKKEDRNGLQRSLSERALNNMYFFSMLGSRLKNSNISVGGSFFWAGLDGIQGVEFLYANSEKIEQDGNIVDCRLGLLSEMNGDCLFEAMVIYNRLDMTHHVTYIDWFWEGWLSFPRDRKEINLDRSRTWGFHLGYSQPIDRKGLRVGTILTGNWKSHPKIPNYEIMNIPRDPGNSWAYRIGFGLSQSKGGAAFGIDFILEPIWSNTWADAASPMVTKSGIIIPKGGKTVENDFKFFNKILSVGLRKENNRFGFQLGLNVRAIQYKLDQYNYIEEFRRKQKEDWIEWTPSWGWVFKFQEFEIRYMGRITTGTGLPGVNGSSPSFPPQWIDDEIALKMDYASDFLLAPSGDLTLRDVKVVTHQISIIIPLN